MHPYRLPFAIEAGVIPALNRGAIAALFLALFAASSYLANAQGNLGAARVGQEAGSRAISTLDPVAEASPIAGDSVADYPAGGDDFGGDYGRQQLINDTQYTRTVFNPWQIGVDNGAFYTDNAFLLKGTEGLDDWFWRGGAYARYTNKIIGNLFFQGAVSEYLYRYHENRGLNFDLFTADAGLFYTLEHFYQPTLFVRYDYYRVNDDGHWDDDLFYNHGLIIGLQKTLPVRRGHQLYFGYSSDISLNAEPQIAQRHEHGVYAGYVVDWTDRIRTSLNCKVAYYDYWQVGRSDWNTVSDLSLEYRLNDWARLVANVSYALNESNFSVFDYDAWGTGANLMLKIER